MTSSSFYSTVPSKGGKSFGFHLSLWVNYGLGPGRDLEITKPSRRGLPMAHKAWPEHADGVIDSSDGIKLGVK